MVSTPARILGPHDGPAGRLGAIGVRFMIDGAKSRGELLPRGTPHARAGLGRAVAPAQPGR